MLSKKLIVKQNGFKDCGASCLLSIMKYYGCEASHEEVTFTLKTGVDGTNAYNIINGSRLYGFDGYGIHYTYEEIINSELGIYEKRDEDAHDITPFVLAFEASSRAGQ